MTTPTVKVMGDEILELARGTILEEIDWKTLERDYIMIAIGTFAEGRDILIRDSSVYLDGVFCRESSVWRLPIYKRWFKEENTYKRKRESTDKKNLQKYLASSSDKEYIIPIEDYIWLQQKEKTNEEVS